jgi:hypothetical protein
MGVGVLQVLFLTRLGKLLMQLYSATTWNVYISFGPNGCAGRSWQELELRSCKASYYGWGINDDNEMCSLRIFGSVVLSP